MLAPGQCARGKTETLCNRTEAGPLQHNKKKPEMTEHFNACNPTTCYVQWLAAHEVRQKRNVHWL